MRCAALLALTLSASSASAHTLWVWESTSLNSAELSGSGWQLTETVGLTRPGEVEKIVTFWTGTLDGRTVVVRCISSLNFGDFRDEEICQLPVQEGETVSPSEP